MTAIAVSVYAADGTTLIANVPSRRGVRFLDELNGDGTGAFEIHLDDDTLAAHPTLLDGGNIVKMRPTNVAAPVFAWQREQRTATLTSEGEKAERYCTLSGRGVRTLLATGALRPEGGLASTSGGDRSFSYTGAIWPNYISADWITPAGVLWTADTTARAGFPSGWPDNSAYYIWSSSPNSPSAVGRNWFRTTFTVATAGDVGIWCTGDNIFSMSLDGVDAVLESDPADLYAWKKMFFYSATLAAGTHTLAVRVDNAAGTGSNPAGFLATIATLDADGIPLSVLRRTDTTNWLVHSYAPPEPGWYPASILKQCIGEAQANSEVQIVPLALGYTDTTDTSGAAWTTTVSESFPVGTDLLSLLARCIEMGIDVEVTPNLVVNAWVRKGTDLSATVRLLPGRDVISNVPTDTFGALRNSALVRHGTGWVLVEDSASVTAHGRRSTSINLGGVTSDAQAITQAQAYFLETAHPQVTLPFTIRSTSSGPLPYVDFHLGDTITVPGIDGVLTPARVMSIETIEQDGYLEYEVHCYPETS